MTDAPLATDTTPNDTAKTPTATLMTSAELMIGRTSAGIVLRSVMRFIYL